MGMLFWTGILFPAGGTLKLPPVVIPILGCENWNSAPRLCGVGGEAGTGMLFCIGILLKVGGWLKNPPVVIPILASEAWNSGSRFWGTLVELKVGILFWIGILFTVGGMLKNPPVVPRLTGSCKAGSRLCAASAGTGAALTEEAAAFENMNGKATRANFCSLDNCIVVVCLRSRIRNDVQQSDENSYGEMTSIFIPSIFRVWRISAVVALHISSLRIPI